MTRFTRIALLTGATLSALVVAGCQKDGATPVGPSSSDLMPVAPGTQPSLRPPLVLYGSDGHTYQVAFNFDGTTTHSVDGAAFALVTPSTGGSNVAYLSGGSVLYSDFFAVEASAPAGLPFVGGGARPSRPPREGDENNGGPQGLMTTCGEQIRNYISASGTLIAAGAALSAHRNSSTIKAMALAAANWVSAWMDLYNCEVAANTNAPPVIGG